MARDVLCTARDTAGRAAPHDTEEDLLSPPGAARDDSCIRVLDGEP